MQDETNNTFTLSQLETSMRMYCNNCMGLTWTAQLDEYTSLQICSFGVVALLMQLGVGKSLEIEELIKKVLHATTIFYYRSDGRLRNVPLEGAVVQERLRP